MLPTPFQNRFPLDEEGRCALCRTGLRGFDAAYSFGSYDGALRQLIHVYKYGKVRTLDRPLGDLLAAGATARRAFDCGDAGAVALAETLAARI